jgi:hypothetical protein
LRGPRNNRLDLAVVVACLAGILGILVGGVLILGHGLEEDEGIVYKTAPTGVPILVGSAAILGLAVRAHSRQRPALLLVAGGIAVALVIFWIGVTAI